MLKFWNMREIVILVILSILCGVVYMPWGGVWEILAAFSPVAGESVYGLWFLASVLVAYVIRKPGAAFLAEMVAALGELLLGSIFGLPMLISALIQGALAELAFAAFGYRKYNLPVLMLAGALPAVGSFILEYFKSELATMSSTMLIASLVVRIISGAVLTGVLGKVVADLLAGTGVLNSYAIVRDRRNNETL